MWVILNFRFYHVRYWQVYRAKDSPVLWQHIYGHVPRPAYKLDQNTIAVNFACFFYSTLFYLIQHNSVLLYLLLHTHAVIVFSPKLCKIQKLSPA